MAAMRLVSVLLNAVKRYVEDRSIAEGQFLSQLRAVYRVKVER
jgi:hypothetical protein